MKRFRIAFLFFPTLLFFVISAQASIFQTGKVVGVSDGDTVTVLVDRTPVKVRLYGVDCPESGQDFGNRAKQFASNMVFGKTVTMEILDTDKYGRTVANVLIGDKSLNEELIKAGFAWVYTQYCKIPICRKWYQYEAQAKKQRTGLWSHPNPIPPWEFRRGKTTINKAPGSIATGVYRGNTRSMVFHQSTCEHFKCKNCTDVFQDRKKAIKAGYRPCGNCKP